MDRYSGWRSVGRQLAPSSYGGPRSDMGYRSSFSSLEPSVSSLSGAFGNRVDDGHAFGSNRGYETHPQYPDTSYAYGYGYRSQNCDGYERSMDARTAQHRDPLQYNKYEYLSRFADDSRLQHRDVAMDARNPKESLLYERYADSYGLVSDARLKHGVEDFVHQTVKDYEHALHPRSSSYSLAKEDLKPWDLSVSKHEQSNRLSEKNDSKVDVVSTKFSEAQHIEEETSAKHVVVEEKPKNKRQSRWEPEQNAEGNDLEGFKKKKSRWGVPLSDIQVLYIRLQELNRKLQSGDVLDEKDISERSPSPEPLLNNVGLRINTREARARVKLMEERAKVISDLIAMDPQFKPPHDYKPQKLRRKLMIPVKEYPNYNFIGLIIGPQGVTLKTMQKESGAKILIRGKGSCKDGSAPTEHEDLHVFIEADTEESLQKAVAMVEKLLIPVEDGQNEHKRAQLQMLAEIKSRKFIPNAICMACGDEGHATEVCSKRTGTMNAVVENKSTLTAQTEHLSTSGLTVICTFCGVKDHDIDVCPKKSAIANKVVDGNKSMLIVTEVEKGLVNGPSTNYNLGNERPAAITGTYLHVYNLSLSMSEEGLRQLFSPFGNIENVFVASDPITGSSQSHGFVKYSDADTAAQAAALANGFILDGCQLDVRVASEPTSSFKDALQRQSLSSGIASHYSLPSSSGTPYDFYNPTVGNFDIASGVYGGKIRYLKFSDVAGPGHH